MSPLRNQGVLHDIARIYHSGILSYELRLLFLVLFSGKNFWGIKIILRLIKANKNLCHFLILVLICTTNLDVE